VSDIDPTNLKEVAWMLAPLRRAPTPDAPLETEALRGEAVAVGEDDGEGWVRARLVADGYEGFMPAMALTTLGPRATHWVTVPRTLGFPAADFKQPPIAALTAGARVRVVRMVGRYAVTEHGEFLIADHLMPLGQHAAPDIVAFAETLLNTPYLWGGKSAMGIDCSGLVQLACVMTGVAAPRDTGPQERTLGDVLPPDIDKGTLRRGDLLFWPGHVAIARGDGTMIHANAHHMAVAIESIAEGVARISAKGDVLRTLRRI
jgi:cell wall-associated NlpC family hydrolase